jgi:hypothetical protein
MRRLMEDEEATGFLADLICIGPCLWWPGAWFDCCYDLFYDTFVCIGTLTNILQ